MIVANFYHLKNTNGLFYYGVDYLADSARHLRKVLVRPSMRESVEKAFPGIPVVPCNLRQLIVEIVGAAVRGDFIYTPSSHPIPFISKQMVVVHDPYPFFGRIGAVKRWLLQMSLLTSRCRVGYINHSDAQALVIRLGVSKRQGIYSPNKFPLPPELDRGSTRRSSGEVTVGLFGTDSPKKKYRELFAALLVRETNVEVRFLVYGHRTKYFEGLTAEFPLLKIELAESDKWSLGEFLEKIDMVVSVAEHEGFGRPIAAALLGGVPCLLLERPVFKEFFVGGAEFRPDLPGVVARMLEMASTPSFAAVSYKPPANAINGYRDAVAFLQAEAAGAV
jgi:hypothetical protein